MIVVMVVVVIVVMIVVMVVVKTVTADQGSMHCSLTQQPLRHIHSMHTYMRSIHATIVKVQGNLAWRSLLCLV